jgi:hypothetical protein
MEMPTDNGKSKQSFFISVTSFFDIIPQFSKGFKQIIQQKTLAFCPPKWYVIFVMNRKAMTKKVA